MDSSLDLYRIFYTVVQAKSFSGAAKLLYISQPAVSQSVRQLEDALGTRLFIRSSRGITLTPEGEILYGYIYSAINLISAGENRITKMNELSAGELRIGAGDTVSKWYLLPVIERFHELYPDVSLRITNRTSEETIELLRDGRLDVGFVNMPLSADGIIFEDCMSVHDIFVAGSQFAYLKDKVISLQELSELPLIMLERASNSRRWVDRHFMTNGVDLKADTELGAHDLLLDYAKIGLGVACVIKEFAYPALAGGGLFEIRLDQPVAARSLAACYLENIGTSPAARRFVDLAKAMTPE